MLENKSKLIELYEQEAAENNRNITKRRNSGHFYGYSNASSKFPKAQVTARPNQYLSIATSGGLNKQRTGITYVVVVARILNATLVVPKLDQRSCWKDSSNFSKIFDVNWFTYQNYQATPKY
ncbi:hypothetical protein RYX36_036085 [Vicia faba]